ncbi:hypothetical protein BC941DRAFT_441233 [Chlamydoabsidia padenii]|nr:hypothetical protein BC941DRAFT_441233 [Chlamydoabsidia padenii]
MESQNMMMSMMMQQMQRMPAPALYQPPHQYNFPAPPPTQPISTSFPTLHTQTQPQPQRLSNSRN